MEGQFINIEQFVDLLKKRWKIIASMFIGFVFVAIILSFFVMEPKYEAKTKFFIGKESYGEDQYYSQNDVSMYQSLMKTYSEIIRLPDILLNSIEEANIDSTLNDVESKLEVTAISDTQILEVSYRSTDPNEAMCFIESITEEFIEVSEELVPNGSIKVIQKVRLPEDPISPNKKINILIGGFLGIILGIVLVFFMEIFDKTIRSKEELEMEVDVPIIGILPLVDKQE